VALGRAAGVALTGDAALVAAAREDGAQFRALVVRYQGRVFATALRMLGNESDARDITQETFLRAFKNLERFDLERPFGPWVCAIAANLARDELRRPLRRLRALAVFRASRDAAAPEPDAAIAASEEGAELAARLLELKPKLREALVLRYVSDLSMLEVADALGISESAAKMRIKRGLEQLRLELPQD